MRRQACYVRVVVLCIRSHPGIHMYRLVSVARSENIGDVVGLLIQSHGAKYTIAKESGGGEMQA